MGEGRNGHRTTVDLLRGLAASLDALTNAASPHAGLNRTDMRAYWSANTGYVPVRTSVYQDSTFQAALKKYPQFQVAVDELHLGTSSYYNAGSVTGTMTGARNNIQTEIDAYLNGKISSAQDALDQAAKQANADLSEYNSANS